MKHRTCAQGAQTAARAREHRKRPRSRLRERIAYGWLGAAPAHIWRPAAYSGTDDASEENALTFATNISSPHLFTTPTLDATAVNMVPAHRQRLAMAARSCVRDEGTVSCVLEWGRSPACGLLRAR
jgi:hypothetical protein